MWTPETTSPGAWRSIISVLLPLSAIGAVVLLGIRGRLSMLDFERTLELRLRRIEDALPTTPPTPAAERSATTEPGTAVHTAREQ